MMDRVWKPSVDISPNCPRCGCSNTKFCYYNNYSLTQPRYFCKGCRRYWTKGGSLRNVPVGGGCRKNRRGKSLRLVTSAADGVRSKNLGYRSTTVPGGDPIGHSYGVNGGSLLADSTRSSALHDGSHIDLALVYANFLNPTPDCERGGTTNNGSEMPELGSDHFDTSLEFSSTAPDHVTGGSSCLQLPQIPELSTGKCCDRNEQIYFCGLDSFHQHQDDYQHCAGDFVLPPLPDQELLWSSTASDHMMVSQTMQATELPVIGPDHQTHQDHKNLLTCNWSPFDLPSDDTFSGGVDEKI